MARTFEQMDPGDFAKMYYGQYNDFADREASLRMQAAQEREHLTDALQQAEEQIEHLESMLAALILGIDECWARTDEGKKVVAQIKEYAESSDLFMECPRCNGQQYDKDNCNLCMGAGFVAVGFTQE